MSNWGVKNYMKEDHRSYSCIYDCDDLLSYNTLRKC